MHRTREQAWPQLPPLEGLCLAICHDLRGPVATAEEAVRGLERELTAPCGDPRRFLEIARRSLAKADELLGSLPRLLLDAGESRPQPMELDELISQVRDDIDLDLRAARGTLRVSPLPRVLGDPLRLRIALRNLLQNAIRYRRAHVPLQIRIRAWRRAQRWTITLSDNGMGLPRPGEGRTSGGLGLGLLIARQAVASSGGTIAASSRPGSGTTFAITLPAADGSPVTGGSDARASPP
jgi:signal transduction histidine kinase